MKKITLLSFAACTMLLLGSCEKALKDVKDYYPEVNTVSVIDLNDGNVIVSAEIISEGNREIEYAGFCMDTLPYPKLSKNQLICDLKGSNFTGTYSGFKKKKKYYFRSWAVNENGYSYGNTIVIDSIVIVPVVAPCTLADKYLSVGLGFPTTTVYYATKPTLVGFTWDFTAEGFSSASGRLRFSFFSKPTTGVYKTKNTLSTAKDVKLTIQFPNAGTFYSSLEGSSIYVNEVGGDKIKVEICSAGWKTSSSSSFTNYVETNFTTQ